jgi:hypothetical protein
MVQGVSKLVLTARPPRAPPKSAAEPKVLLPTKFWSWTPLEKRKKDKELTFRNRNSTKVTNK